MMASTHDLNCNHCAACPDAAAAIAFNHHTALTISLHARNLKKCSCTYNNTTISGHHIMPTFSLSLFSSLLLTVDRSVGQLVGHYIRLSIHFFVYN